MSNTNTANEPFTQTASTGGTVKDENLTIRGHIDPDKHWIGESLPSPSDQETTYAGVTTSAGSSPFPARANHSHASRTVFGIYYTPVAQAIPPGVTYINNFQLVNGRDMRAPGSTQLFIFPMGGVYHIFMNWYASREGGGLFTGEMNIAVVYFNGTYPRYVMRQSNFDVPSSLAGFIVDHAHFGAGVDSGSNVQIRIEHNDTVNMLFLVNYLEITRMGDYVSA